MTSPARTTFTPDDFQIRRLGRDNDALLLLLLGGVMLVAALAALAFLPEPAWDRLVERSKVLWLAGAALVPVLLAAWGRFQVRKSAAAAMGVAAAASETPAPRPYVQFYDPATAPTSSGSDPARTGEQAQTAWEYIVVLLVVAAAVALAIIALGGF